MRFAPYPSYKPSGVEWLGDVPEHWKVLAARHVAIRIKTGSTPPTSEERYYEEGTVPWFGPGSFDDAILLSRPVKWLHASAVSEGAARLFCAGTTMVVTIGATLGKVSSLTEPGSSNQQITAIEFDNGRVHARFGTYQLKRLEAELRAIAPSATLPILGQDDVACIELALPSVDEQQAIADFLDRETAKIDTLVAKKRALIERLQEKRTALISRTVTRGLPPDAARAAGFDPHPRLKPSGIDWLGDVPEHWDACRIKYVAKIESGHTPARSVDEYWTDCNIPWVSLNDSGYLRTHDYISETVYRISELGMANSSARLLPPKAVVFSRDATVGLCAITTVPMAVSQHFVAYLCGPRLLPEYLLLSLKAMSQHLERLSMGATISTIGMDDVRSLACAVPSVQEQALIVQYVNTGTTKLDQMVAKIETAIERLQEYRTALITAAVTGKIDVRGADA